MLAVIHWCKEMHVFSEDLMFYDRNLVKIVQILSTRLAGMACT